MNNEDEIKSKRMEMLGELENEADKKKVSAKDIAETAGLQESTIKRIFLGKFPPTLDVYIAIREAIFSKK